MIELLNNLTARRLLGVIVVLGAADWIGGKLAGHEPTATEFLVMGGFLISFAIIDHLHGIRRALENRTSTRL